MTIAVFTLTQRTVYVYTYEGQMMLTFNRWKQTTTALLVCLSFVFTFNITASGAEGTTLRNETNATFNVGTFNIHGGSAQLPMTDGRLTRISDEIKKLNYTVLGMQESKTSVRDSLVSKLGNTYSFSSLGDTKNRNTTGGLIWYRKDLLHAGALQGKIALPTPARGNPRTGLYQDFYDIKTGARFLFVSVHLSNLDGRAATEVRKAQTETLMTEIKKVNIENIPLIIVGDMNSNAAKKYVYDAPRQVYERENLVEIFNTNAKKINANFNSFNHLNTTPKTGGYRPDQIYVSGQVKVQTAETVMRVKIKKVKIKKAKGKVVYKKKIRYKTPFLSDHNAIKSQVTLAVT